MARRRNVRRNSPWVYVGLILVSLISIYPLYFVLIIASRSLDALNNPSPTWLPGGEFLNNFNKALEREDVHFWKGMINSVIVSSVVTISVVLTSTLAGFAFAKLKFRGRNALMLTILVTMMVPAQLGIIPLWGMMQQWGLVYDIWAVILPFLTSAFGVFLMRQYTLSAVPDELIEAARVDGCSTFRTYYSVVMPAVIPGAAVLGLLTFMEQWNSYLWPRAALSPENPTLQVTLGFISYAYYTDYSLVFAALAVAILPLILVFLFFGKQIIGGIMEGAVKA
jgi:cellobiose transport system permease protein